MADTTLTTAIDAGAGIVATPVSMAGIVANMNLMVGGEANTDVGKGEWVTVISIDDTSFTANFLHPHEAGAWVTYTFGTGGHATMWGT